MQATTEARDRAFHGSGMQNSIGRSATPGWDLGPERRIDDGETLASMIGWFSLGLGALEIFATEEVCEFLGMEDQATLVRLYGVREIAKGLGILSQRRPRGWMYARIAGDVLDLATLAMNLESNRKRSNVAFAMGAVAGVMALDILCARQLSKRH
jgi:hypothetical protein